MFANDYTRHVADWKYVASEENLDKPKINAREVFQKRLNELEAKLERTTNATIAHRQIYRLIRLNEDLLERMK